jgi:hypothetical protein
VVDPALKLRVTRPTQRKMPIKHVGLYAQNTGTRQTTTT